MITQHLSIDQMKDSMRAPWIAGDFGAIATGHEVLGLARSDASAQALNSVGANV